ncbi:MAG: Mut7-C RNAse domain-containing protein [Elusimicrobiota bacterium]|nr:Mut7-C RNAse domain-containing protein [Elusimicrobiota bacterium]
MKEVIYHVVKHHIHPEKTEEPKFLVDFMLGRLAKWLIIWGYDAEYYRQSDRHGILLKSLQEKRVILTRDHTLSKKRAWKLRLIKSNFLDEQIEQVAQEFELKLDKERLFSRCTICNLPIEQIEKEKIKDKVPPYIYNSQTEFSYCKQCGRVYWPGTHLEMILNKLEKK